MQRRDTVRWATNHRNFYLTPIEALRTCVYVRKRRYSTYSPKLHPSLQRRDVFDRSTEDNDQFNFVVALPSAQGGITTSVLGPESVELGL